MNGSHAQATFLHWLQSEGYVLAEKHEHGPTCEIDPVDDYLGEGPNIVCGYGEGELVRTMVPIEDLVNRFWNIDPDKIEQEQRLMKRRHHPQRSVHQ